MQAKPPLWNLTVYLSIRQVHSEVPQRGVEGHPFQIAVRFFLAINVENHCIFVWGWRPGQTEQLHKLSNPSSSPDCWCKGDLHESHLRDIFWSFASSRLSAPFWSQGFEKKTSREISSGVLRSKWLKQVADRNTWVAVRISALIPLIWLFCMWEINWLLRIPKTSQVVINVTLRIL